MLIVVLLIAGIAAAVVIVWQPFLGLLLLIASVPMEDLFMAGEGMTANRALGTAVFGAWVLYKLLTRSAWRPVVASGLFLAGAAFILLLLASALWAQNPSIAVRGTVNMAQRFALSLLVVDLASSWKRLDLIVKALVIACAVTAILTIQQAFDPEVERAGRGIAGGVNATATVLLVLIPFGFYLFRSRQAAVWRLCGLTAVVLAVLAISVTYSRMVFLLVPPLLVALYWDTLRGRSGWRWLFMLTAGAVVAAVLFVPWEGVLRRAGTITPYLGRTIQSATEDSEGPSDRGYHLKVGLAIGRDHPILGVGYRNYGIRFRDEYQFIVPGAHHVYGTANRNPHSSLVGMFANLGVVGLLLWHTLLGVCLWYALKAWSASRADPRSSPHILAQAVTYSLLLYAVPLGLYSSTENHKLLWVLFGMSLVLCRIVTQGSRSRIPPPRVPATLRSHPYAWTSAVTVKEE